LPPLFAAAVGHLYTSAAIIFRSSTEREHGRVAAGPHDLAAEILDVVVA